MSSVATPLAYAVHDDVVASHDLCILSSNEADVHVAFAPDLALLACSMRHRGEELLGQRGGLTSYARDGETMGIPLLHPWANRLGAFAYGFGGRSVRVDGRTALDDRGLPIHGLLAATRHWTRTAAGADADGAWVRARMDAGLRPDVLAGFPFPHVLDVEARLRGTSLTIETVLRPTGSVPVPVCFGYHPYLRLPGAPRRAWEIDLPAARRLGLDGRGIPTGEAGPVERIGGALGERTFDDAFVVAGSEPFVVAGGGRRIEVAFETGYPYAQLFAPADDDVVCFEPMTAPTDALRGLRAAPPSVAPGSTYRARFAITVKAEP